MMPCHQILCLLLQKGPLTWPRLCAAVGTDDTSPESPAWEPLEHLIELGLVRIAWMAVQGERAQVQHGGDVPGNRLAREPRMEGSMRPGRKLGTDALYARELGITRRAVKRYGGANKLRSMTEDARRILIGHLLPPAKPISRVPGAVSQRVA